MILYHILSNAGSLIPSKSLRPVNESNTYFECRQNVYTKPVSRIFDRK